MTQTEAKTYNGWKNYETWVTKLWLDNEEGTQELQREWAEVAVTREPPHEGYWTQEETTRFTLAEIVKEFVEDNNPLADTATMYSDLMRAAIQEVDFQEIADNILSNS